MKPYKTSSCLVSGKEELLMIQDITLSLKIKTTNTIISQDKG